MIQLMILQYISEREAWNSAWNTTPGGGLLMGSCSIPEAPRRAAP